MTNDRRLVIAAVLLALNFVLGLVVSIDQGWAYEFGGIGDPNNVSGEWVAHGTYLAPPLAPALVFLIGFGLSRLRGLAGAAGVVVMMLTSVAFLVGIFGEPWRPVGFDPPVGVVLLFRLSSVAAAVGVIVFGALTLVGRRRANRTAAA